MLKTGILNPDLLHLLARIRHTNRLVIADRGFPYWKDLEIVDLSLVDGIPTVLQVLEAVRLNLDIEQIYMAQEFNLENNPETKKRFAEAMHGIPVAFEAHDQFKLRVPGSIGLVRTGDTVQYANLILVSGRVEG
jgi:D-ribose pyranase